MQELGRVRHIRRQGDSCSWDAIKELTIQKKSARKSPTRGKSCHSKLSMLYSMLQRSASNGSGAHIDLSDRCVSIDLASKQYAVLCKPGLTVLMSHSVALAPIAFAIFVHTVSVREADRF